MEKNKSSCFKVSDTGICPHCKGKELVKNGFTKNKKQQYYCKSCMKRFIDYYSYNAYQTRWRGFVIRAGNKSTVIKKFYLS